MGRYIVRRLLVALPTLAVVMATMAGFTALESDEVITARFWCNTEPATSSPVRTVALGATGGAPRTGPGCSFTKEDIEKILEELGIGKSFSERYLEWIGGALRGDLGTSLRNDQGVSDKIAERLPASAQLAVMALAVAVLTAVPTGVLAAVRHGTWPDYVARLTSLAGLSIPDFMLATIVFFVLSAWIGWLPDLDYPAPWESPWASFQAFALPALVVGWRIGAISARMTRSAVLDVLRQDYVRTARAKGLTEHSVLVRHALRNALLPVLTIIGMQVPALLGGLVIIEIVFGLPGLGTLGFEAVQAFDYPVVQGVVFCAALCVIASNLVIDVAYAAMDPRIRYA